MDNARHNEWFRSARTTVFASRAALAAAVNAELPPAYALTAADIGKIERGVIAFPPSVRRAALRRILGAEADSDLGFRNARDPRQ